MFTGIIEELGEITQITPAAGGEVRVRIRGPLVTSDARLGDSIAVNGACLTVAELIGDEFEIEAVPETMRRTALGALKAGSPVNLERAMIAGARLDGHIVQGHVDGIGRLRSRTSGGRWEELVFEHAPELARFIAEKGSIAVNGTSLTVTTVTADSFGVALIPLTLERTTLGGLAVGDPVNLEIDVIARYVARLHETEIAA